MAPKDRKDDGTSSCWTRKDRFILINCIDTRCYGRAVWRRVGTGCGSVDGRQGGGRPAVSCVSQKSTDAHRRKLSCLFLLLLLERRERKKGTVTLSLVWEWCPAAHVVCAGIFDHCNRGTGARERKPTQKSTVPGMARCAPRCQTVPSTGGLRSLRLEVVKMPSMIRSRTGISVRWDPAKESGTVGRWCVCCVSVCVVFPSKPCEVSPFPRGTKDEVRYHSAFFALLSMHLRALSRRLNKQSGDTRLITQGDASEQACASVELAAPPSAL